MAEQVDHAQKVLALNDELQLLGSLSKESIEYLIEQAAAAEVFRAYTAVLAQAAMAYRDLAEEDIFKLETENLTLKEQVREYELALNGDSTNG